MNPTVLDNQPHPAMQKPHLSYSSINRYLFCPEQYRLYYEEKLRPRFLSASLVFGKIVHQALSNLFQNGSDLINTFSASWNEVKDINLTYSGRDSWESLKGKGEKMLALFMETEYSRFGKIIASEEVFELSISCFEKPFVGIIDLIAEVDSVSTVVDFKTSGSSSQEYESDLSDQLTAYHLSKPTIEKCALCCLIHTKEPKIEWQYSTRSPEQGEEYLRKVELIAGEISCGRFYKRSGKWCSYCDYLPFCLGSKSWIENTLVKID